MLRKSQWRYWCLRPLSMFLNKNPKKVSSLLFFQIYCSLGRNSIAINRVINQMHLLVSVVKNSCFENFEKSLRINQATHLRPRMDSCL